MLRNLNILVYLPNYLIKIVTFIIFFNFIVSPLFQLERLKTLQKGPCRPYRNLRFNHASSCVIQLVIKNKLDYYFIK